MIECDGTTTVLKFGSDQLVHKWNILLRAALIDSDRPEVLEQQSQRVQKKAQDKKQRAVNSQNQQKHARARHRRNLSTMSSSSTRSSNDQATLPDEIRLPGSEPGGEGATSSKGSKKEKDNSRPKEGKTDGKRSRKRLNKRSQSEIVGGGAAAAAPQLGTSSDKVVVVEGWWTLERKEGVKQWHPLKEMPDTMRSAVQKRLEKNNEKKRRAAEAAGGGAPAPGESDGHDTEKARATAKAKSAQAAADVMTGKSTSSATMGKKLKKVHLRAQKRKQDIVRSLKSSHAAKQLSLSLKTEDLNEALRIHRAENAAKGGGAGAVSGGVTAGGDDEKINKQRKREKKTRAAPAAPLPPPAPAATAGATAGGEGRLGGDKAVGPAESEFVSSEFPLLLAVKAADTTVAALRTDDENANTVAVLGSSAEESTPVGADARLKRTASMRQLYDSGDINEDEFRNLLEADARFQAEQLAKEQQQQQQQAQEPQVSAPSRPPLKSRGSSVADEMFENGEINEEEHRVLLEADARFARAIEGEIVVDP